MDFERDGNYEIPCPDCGHIHYRAVRDGLITETRYDPHETHMVWQTAYTYGFTATTTASTGGATTLAWSSYSDATDTATGGW